MDIGLYHLKTFSEAVELFTVDDGTNVHIYERPYGAGAVEIRRAVAVAFIDQQDSSLEHRIAGRFPNYHVEEVTA